MRINSCCGARSADLAFFMPLFEYKLTNVKEQILFLTFTVQVYVTTIKQLNNNYYEEL